MSATQDEVNKQRAALLTAVAQQGTAGKTAYEAEAARQAEAAKAAAAAVSGSVHGTAMGVPPALLAQIAAQNAAQQSVYAQDNKMASTNYNNSLAQTSMSNAAYMDQARAAVPVVEAQTRGTIAQIRAQQEEQRLQREEAAKERAYNERMRALGLQEKQAAEHGDAQKYLQDMQAAGRESIGKRIQREAGDLVPAISSIVGMSDTLGQAVIAARELMRKQAMAYNADKKHKDKFSEGEIRASTNKVMRYLYLYYTGKDPEWHDAQTFGMQLHNFNVNPRHVYGYDPALGGRVGPAGIQGP